jgi:(S)-2-hydroxy-acid oxidase
VFGRKISFSVCVAPTGLQQLAHPDGELANARACAKAGVCMGISSFSNTELEEMVSAGEGKMEFGLQLYILRNMEVTRRLVAEAEGTWHKLCCYVLSFLGVR